jgi:PBSX family phage terminase large subunit
VPTVELTYTPYGAARALFADRSPEVLLSGAAGTGKSRACLEKLHLVASKYAGSRLIIVRKQRNAITQTAMVSFEKKVLHPLDGVYWFATRQEYRYPNGSIIAVAGMDDPAKILSSEFDIAYVQEATELDLEDWETLLGRLRYGRTPYNQIIADCNPASNQHWLYRRWQRDALTILWSEHEENPELFNQATGEMTPFGRSYLSNLDRLTGFRLQRLRYGRWVGAEGLVYTDFDPASMVREVDVTDWPRRVLGVDVGTRNPTAILRIAGSGDDRTHVAGELYRAGMTSEEIVEEIEVAADEFEAESIEIDPSASGYILQLERDGYPVNKANNDRRFGIAAVHEAIAAGLTVDPSCRGLVAEFGLYAYPPGAATSLGVEDGETREDGKDDPVKKDDHALDALRYGVVGLATVSSPGIW